MLKLSRREIILLQVLGGLIGLLFLYYFLIMPVINFKSKTEDLNKSSRDKLVRFDEIVYQYRETRNEKDRLENAVVSGTGISTLVDEITGTLNISGNKVYLRERPGRIQEGIQIITTEMKFEGLNIQLLLEFINRLENSNTMLKIKNITLTAGLKDTNRYDAVITVTSFYRR